MSNLRKLAEAATPGEWHVREGIDWNARVMDSVSVSTLQETIADTKTAADAAFIAAANPAAILDLLDRLDRAEKIAELAREYVRTMDEVASMRAGTGNTPTWGAYLAACDRYDAVEAALLAAVRANQ